MSKDLDVLGAEVRKSLRHMRLVVEPLESDLTRCTKELEADRSSQYLRRIIIRMVGGYVEAIAFQMKVTALKLGPVVGINFTADELEVLTEKRSNSGRAKFIPLMENLKFALQTFARIHSVNFSLDTSASGYQDFLHMIEVRNRVTHPKSVMDVGITDSDLERCAGASGWFTDEYGRLMQSCSAVVEQMVQQARNKR